MGTEKTGITLAFHHADISYREAAVTDRLFEIDLCQRGLAVGTIAELTEVSAVMDLCHLLPTCARGGKVHFGEHTRIMYHLLNAERQVVDTYVF